LLPLWLLLAAFVGHTTMPPVVWGALAPRESEHESDASQEAWKWTAGESRGTIHGRRQRLSTASFTRMGGALGIPCTRQIRTTSTTRAAHTELAGRNGCGAPLRC
jgi:hypothetical protein